VTGEPPASDNAQQRAGGGRQARSASIAAALLALVIVGTEYDVIFQGRSLIATNFYNPLDFRDLPQNYGPDHVPHDEWTRRHLYPYANIRDPGATWWQWEPGTQFLKQAIRTAEWPFWDPYIAGGTPAMANLVSAFFFPPFLIVVLLGASVPLLNAYFLLLLWSASFFTFLFIRRHGLGFLPSLIAALAFLLSGTMHQHLGTFIGQTAACLPLALYVTRVFADRPGRTRAIAVALVYGAIALASFPPVLVAIFGTVAIYAIVAILTEQLPRDRARATAWWCGGAALGCGLVAWYYLPALAARAASPQVSGAYRGVGLETMRPWNLFQLLSPTLTGGTQTYLPPLPLAGFEGPYLPYVGMVVVALAFLSRSSTGPKSRTLWIASLAVTAAIILKLLGVPLVQWIGRLPMLGEIHMAHYFGLVLPFLLACLAALGLEAILAGRTGPVRALLVGIAVLVTVESLWQMADAGNVFGSAGGAAWTRDWRVLATVSALGAATILIAALARANTRTRRLAAAMLVCLCVSEGVYDGWFPNPRAWSIFDHPVPFVKVLQQTPSTRMLAFGAPNANVNSAFGVASLDSLMAFNPPRAYRLYTKYADPPREAFMRGATRVPPEPVLDRANIGLLGTRSAFLPIVNDAQARGHERVFDDGFIAVFRRPTLPRFQYSSEYRVVPEDAALEAIANPNSREIVLESPPGVDATPNTAADPPIVVEASRRNSTMLVVDAPRPGLVYAAESFFDGWTATIDGRPAPILPANYAFRAVVVPAGRSRVEFRYWPPGLTMGLWVSGLSALVLAGLAIARPSRNA
jgi:hypothetical protein